MEITHRQLKLRIDMYRHMDRRVYKHSDPTNREDIKWRSNRKTTKTDRHTDRQVMKRLKDMDVET